LWICAHGDNLAFLIDICGIEFSTYIQDDIWFLVMLRGE